MNILRPCLNKASQPIMMANYTKIGAKQQTASFHVSSFNLANQSRFEEAKQRMSSLKEDPGSEVKLQMYALFKQATVGKVTTKRPSMVDFVGRAKWDAWNGLGDMDKDAAMAAYADVVDKLAAAEGVAVNESSSSASATGNFLIEVKDGLRVITLNRPAKKNAITTAMYREWTSLLEEAGKDPKTSITVITGAGDFFCSGNDLANFTNIPEGGPKQLAAESKLVLLDFVNAFIDFPKPLVAVLNGPAVGISVTLLGLYDAVYATDKAWIQTPFTKLGQSAEGCSSYTFPKIMGPGRSTEMLLFNKKMSAKEASEAGLITEVLPHNRLSEEIWPRLRDLATLPPQSLIYGKALVRDIDRAALKKANIDECERLEERWLSDECRDAVVAFLTRNK